MRILEITDKKIYARNDDENRVCVFDIRDIKNPELDIIGYQSGFLCNKDIRRNSVEFAKLVEHLIQMSRERLCLK